MMFRTIEAHNAQRTRDRRNPRGAEGGADNANCGSNSAWNTPNPGLKNPSKSLIIGLSPFNGEDAFRGRKYLSQISTRRRYGFAAQAGLQGRGSPGTIWASRCTTRAVREAARYFGKALR
ncbi:MAG: hypothetical protein ACLVJ6_10830 [Merdibacter sp.]